MRCQEVIWEKKQGSVSHSLFVMAWDETVSQKSCSIAHILFIMGWYVMRLLYENNAYLLFIMEWDLMLPGRQNGAESLTSCWSWNEMWNCMAGTKGSVTHILLVMRWDMMTLLDRKLGSITHKLFIMEWDVMKLLSRTKGQCHSHTVGHGRRCDENVWEMERECHTHPVGHEMWSDFLAENINVTHLLLVRGWNVKKMLGRERRMTLTPCL